MVFSYDYNSQTGKLELYDIAAGVQLETVEAHEGAIWGLSLAPDKVSLNLLFSVIDLLLEAVCMYLTSKYVKE